MHEAMPATRVVELAGSENGAHLCGVARLKAHQQVGFFRVVHQKPADEIVIVADTIRNDAIGVKQYTRVLDPSRAENDDTCPQVVRLPRGSAISIDSRCSPDELVFRCVTVACTRTRRFAV